TTSFFPAKPHGCYGDGGATLTNDAGDDALMRSLAFHGAGADKYDNIHIGMNSRLDAIQAAILIEKLAIFAEEIEMRNAVAARYADLLSPHVATPKVIEGGVSTWAQYTIESEERDALAAHLKAKEIPTAMYYPVPLHRQTAYKHFPAPGAMANTDAAAARVLALPMHPYLDYATQDLIADAIRDFATAGSSSAPRAASA
ncbi:MAG: DegT/DnrJ/EryC1/StrS family aminotransferase, partial [Hyphomonadaceae bacterium]